MNACKCTHQIAMIIKFYLITDWKLIIFEHIDSNQLIIDYNEVKLRYKRWLFNEVLMVFYNFWISFWWLHIYTLR